MIDPLAAVIALVKADVGLQALVEDRIAERHKFGLTTARAWPTPAPALQLLPVPGTQPDREVGFQRLRLEARCYGDRPATAGEVYAALVALTRRTNRAVVPTANGAALIYFLLLDGTPESGFDDDIKIDVQRVYLVAEVAEDPV